MTIRIDVSEEVAQTLQHLAETEHLSINELLTNITEHYEVERQIRSGLISQPDGAEISPTDASYSQTGAKLDTTEEILAELTDDCDD